MGRLAAICDFCRLIGNPLHEQTSGEPHRGALAVSEAKHARDLSGIRLLVDRVGMELEQISYLLYGEDVVRLVDLRLGSFHVQA